jgi:hypothetical protein
VGCSQGRRLGGSGGLSCYWQGNNRQGGGWWHKAPLEGGEGCYDTGTGEGCYDTGTGEGCYDTGTGEVCYDTGTGEA